MYVIANQTEFGKKDSIATAVAEPQAVAVSPYGWLMTHYGWLAG